MNFANKISTFRILIVPFFIACMFYYSPENEYLRFVALVIFILGVISDAVDGYIARKSKQQSRAGLILDPLGDKLLLMGAFIALSPLSKLPIKFSLVVTLVVISRDALIILGTVVIFIVKHTIDLYPTRWGKLTTAFQMCAVIFVLLQARIAVDIFSLLAVLFTIISGMGYVRRGFKILYALDNPRNHH